ncbi:MAG: TusE/DsrC/DsvC family sulfur relay protein [Bacteroidetes bacterium]|nr:TusE/DsrC/DsvC family sulfur relay protein [Bacteroidota bacterium]
MAQKTIAGQSIEVNDEGYMTDASQWNREIAQEMAKEEGIELGDKHFEVLEFLRSSNEKGETLTIRRLGKSGITDIKGLYQLFPGGPLKLSSKYAGIPKPASCV